MMQKQITKIENISNMASLDYYTIMNLSIHKFGNFNLFSGKHENGYEAILSSIRHESGVYNPNVIFRHDLFADLHFTDLKASLRCYFTSDKQIFATTQRLDVIQAFSEVAQEYEDIEAYYDRLGRSAIRSDNNRSIVSMYTVDELIEATSKNREVR